MSNKPLNISESAAVQMPMKTVVSLIALVAIGTWAYFGLHETLNKHSTQIELMQKDLEHNTEFRIKWPRGQMGSLPADQEQFMMIEDLYKSVDRLNKAIEDTQLWALELWDAKEADNPDKFGRPSGCKGQYKVFFDEYCAKTCGICT